MLNDVMVRKEVLLILDSKQKIKDALQKIEGVGYLSLPVVDKQKFVGSISVYHIYQKFYKLKDEERIEFLEEPIWEYINKNIPFLYENQIIEDALDIFSVKNIPFLPVIDKDNNFIGIVTQKLIFKSFNNILGSHQGTRFTIVTYDVKGKLAQIAKIITKSNGNIISIVVDDPKIKMSLKKVIIRFEADNVELVKGRLEKEGFKILDIK